MTTKHEPSIMRRMAGAGRPPPEIGRVTPARALRAAVALAAQEVAALVAVAGNVDEMRTTRDLIAEALPEQSLLGLVEGPQSRFGLVVLDGQAVAALIEMQTTGRVVPRPAPPRAPTRTDAIMCADLIDRMLEVMEEQISEAELPVAPVFAGFRYAMALAEARAIAMTLDDIPYRKLSLTVDFGQGGKSGEIVLILPFDPPGEDGRKRGNTTEFSVDLRNQVLESPAWLAATLARQEMTLADVAQLAVGRVIAVAQEALGAVEIEDLEGHVVARGRLGQVDGVRAVRITGAPAKAIPPEAASVVPDGLGDSGLREANPDGGGDVPDLPEEDALAALATLGAAGEAPVEASG